MTLISVDLPAPLSPISPTISLRPMAMSMSQARARRPNNFARPRGERWTQNHLPPTSLRPIPKNTPTKAAPRAPTFAQLGALGKGRHELNCPRSNQIHGFRGRRRRFG